MTLVSKTLQNVGEPRPSVGVNADDIQAGYNDTVREAYKAGGFVSYPGTALNKGSLEWRGVPCNSGNWKTTVTNSIFTTLDVVHLLPLSTTPVCYLFGSSSTNVMDDDKIISFGNAAAIDTGSGVTLNTQSGIITTQALTVPAGSAVELVVTNSQVKTNSTIILSLQGGTNTIQGIQVQVLGQSGGTFTIQIFNNNPSVPLNGFIRIGFFIANFVTT